VIRNDREEPPAEVPSRTLLRFALGYGSAVLAVTLSFFVYRMLSVSFGAGLPAFITFYPAVMAVAVLAGLGPGLAATTLAAMAAGYWIMPPVGQLYLASTADRLALALFGFMGIFISTVAELYRRSRQKAATYDREPALAEVRREKEFLADLLEHTSQAFAVGYPDGRIGRINQAYEELTGYSAAELGSIDWSATLTPSEWRDLERQKLDELLRTGQPVRYEKQYIRKDGSRVPVELFVHLVRAADGKPDYYYSFIADITERRQAESALRESEEQYRLLFTANPNPMFLFDEETFRFLAVNDAAVRHYGWSRSEFLAMTVLDIRPSEDRAIAEDTIRQHGGAHELGIGVMRHWRKDRTLMDMEITVSSIAFGGRPARLCSLNDITERKQAEEALRESEERFRLALRNAPVSVAVQDRDFRYVWAYNQRTAKPEEIIGRLDSEIFTAEEAARLHVLKRRVLDENVELQEQMWLERPGGRIYLEVFWEPIHDNAGRVIGVGSATVDLTALKLAEEELQKSASELRAANTELRASRAAALNLMEDADSARLDAEITAAALSEREELLSASLAEKEVLLKEIHHRVKNNMQIISSLVALQANESQDPAMRAVLQDVTHRVRSMAMVHEKLYQSADLARIDFAEYARSLLNYLWRAHGTAASHILLDTDLEPVSFPVNEAVPLGLILNELASNALKHAFRDRADGKVAVSLRNDAQGLVHLSVSDNGAGLPMELDWRHAHSLGLRLVQMLAGQLHADVEVRGGDQEGTRFEVIFGGSSINPSQPPLNLRGGENPPS
jgi:PAS domain S-box-containing protein